MTETDAFQCPFQFPMVRMPPPLLVLRDTVTAIINVFQIKAFNEYRWQGGHPFTTAGMLFVNYALTRTF